MAPGLATRARLLWILFVGFVGVACLVHGHLFSAKPTFDDIPQVFRHDAPRLSVPRSYLVAPYWTGRPTGYNHYNRLHDDKG